MEGTTQDHTDKAAALLVTYNVFLGFAMTKVSDFSGQLYNPVSVHLLT